MLSKIKKMELLIEIMKSGEIFEVYNSKFKVSQKIKYENGEFLALNNAKDRYLTAYINLNTLLDDVNTIKRKFVPKRDDNYFVIHGDCVINEYSSDGTTTSYMKVGNCFATREEAEQMRDKILILLQNKE